METKNYIDYDIADISDEDLKSICELEKTISSNTEEDVVLIAYQHKHADKTKSTFF